MYIWSGAFEFMFILVFLIIIGGIIVTAIRGIGQWNKNNQAPQLTVDATVIAKRINVTHNQSVNEADITGAQGCHTTTFTSYYVTFQVESGDRIEFYISGNEYDMLKEGDYGKLIFKGSHYLGFKR
ncbi:MAG: DUF2500 domain-containing protein [Clostridium perfringens]|nr:DUF2500 domain-containing protein [Clostridium perfringens]